MDYMDELIFDGKKYISSSRAGREFDYAPDYIGQLCRSGKISARLVGRAWYVSEESLRGHINQFGKVNDSGAETKVASEKNLSPENSLNKWDISPIREKTVASRYEFDDRPLLPGLRKEGIYKEEPVVFAVEEKREEEKEVSTIVPEEKETGPQEFNLDEEEFVEQVPCEGVEVVAPLRFQDAKDTFSFVRSTLPSP